MAGVVVAALTLAAAGAAWGGLGWLMANIPPTRPLAVLAAYVYSLDNTRLWSNLDCAPSNETLVKTFQPGEQVTTEVTWTGMGSAPQCPLPRQPIGPGTYNLVVQLGNLRSAAVPFILAPPTQAPPPGEGAPPAEQVPAPQGG